MMAHIRKRGEKAKEITREAGKRAVVDHSQSWLHRFRRLLIRWDKQPEHYLAFLHFAYCFACCRVTRIGS